jgi:hypothetical protein
MPWTLDGIRRGFIGDGPNEPDVHPSLNESKQTKKETNKVVFVAKDPIIEFDR